MHKLIIAAALIFNILVPTRVYAKDTKESTSYQRSIVLEIGGSSMTCRESTCSSQSEINYKDRQSKYFGAIRSTTISDGGKDNGVTEVTRDFEKIRKVVSVLGGATIRLIDLVDREFPEIFSNLFASLGAGLYSGSLELNEDGNPDNTNGALIYADLGIETVSGPLNVRLKSEFSYYLPNSGEKKGFHDGNIWSIGVGINF